ncbi:MAG: hypothetical protein K0U93_07215 [Gammaproteobacteria bacterium]|nr:hypothetical protein [Gammaproteobacteria bacterium]
MRSSLLWVMMSFACLSAGARADCDLTWPDDFERQSARLTYAKSQETLVVVSMYSNRCNGGVYLVEAGPSPMPLRVSYWWLDEFRAARITPGDPSPDALTIVATYITGIGPTGAQPFEASTTIRWSDSGWITEPPIIRRLE